MCYFCAGATRELWVTLSPPSYTTTTRRSRSHLRAPTRNLPSSMSRNQRAAPSHSFSDKSSIVFTFTVRYASRLNCRAVFKFFIFRFSFSNILKATANDEVSLESGSLTKSQKNFSTTSPASNNKSPVSAQRGSPVLLRRREVTEEEAERSDPQDSVSTVCVLAALLFLVWVT